jgi:hypothetical protein
MSSCNLRESTAWGMFAGRGFAAGERILRRSEVRFVTPDAPLRPELGEYEHHCDDHSGGRVVLLGFPDRHFNHRCDPNAYVAEIDGVRYIYARRDIVPGEEITNDYCMNARGEAWWTCNCGAPECRGTMKHDFFALPPAKQLEYLPLVMEWFVAENREAIDALRRRGATPR